MLISVSPQVEKVLFEITKGAFDCASVCLLDSLTNSFVNPYRPARQGCCCR